MRYAPSSLPDCYHPHYMTIEDFERDVALGGLERVSGVSTSFHFARLSQQGAWVGYDHFLHGDPRESVPIAEIRVERADATGFYAVIGHDFEEAIAFAHKIAAEANRAGARLHELKGAIDTAFLDFSYIEDFRLNITPEIHSPPLYLLECRRAGDTDWPISPIRFLREQDRQRVVMDIAACAAGKDGFARLDTHCQFPQSLHKTFTGDVFAHYIKPSTVIAALVTEDYHHTTHVYREGTTTLCLLYGHNRWLNFNFGDDLDGARMTARRLLNLNPRLRPIDDKKCFYVDPLRFDKASPFIKPDTQTLGDPESNQVFLHFRGFEFPVSTHWPSVMEAKRIMGLLNYNAAELRKPRLTAQNTPQGRGDVIKLFPS